MPSSQAAKRPTNLSLDKTLLNEARALKINVSQAAEQGLRLEVAKAKAARWKAENAEVMEQANDWVERQGLPLDKYRQF